MVPVAVALHVLVAWSCSAEEPPPIPEYAMLGEEDGFVVAFEGEVDTTRGSYTAVLSGSNLEQNLLPELTDMRIPESAEKRLLDNGWESISLPSPTVDSRDRFSQIRPNHSVEYRKEGSCLLYFDFVGDGSLNGDLLLSQQ